MWSGLSGDSSSLSHMVLTGTAWRLGLGSPEDIENIGADPWTPCNDQTAGNVQEPWEEHDPFQTWTLWRQDFVQSPVWGWMPAVGEELQFLSTWVSPSVWSLVPLGFLTAQWLERRASIPREKRPGSSSPAFSVLTLYLTQQRSQYSPRPTQIPEDRANISQGKKVNVASQAEHVGWGMYRCDCLWKIPCHPGENTSTVHTPTC